MKDIDESLTSKHSKLPMGNCRAVLFQVKKNELSRTSLKSNFCLVF